MAIHCFFFETKSLKICRVFFRLGFPLAMHRVLSAGLYIRQQFCIVNDYLMLCRQTLQMASTMNQINYLEHCSVRSESITNIWKALL